MDVAESEQIQEMDHADTTQETGYVTFFNCLWWGTN